MAVWFQVRTRKPVPRLVQGHGNGNLKYHLGAIGKRKAQSMAPVESIMGQALRGGGVASSTASAALGSSDDEMEEIKPLTSGKLKYAPGKCSTIHLINLNQTTSWVERRMIDRILNDNHI